MKKYFIIVLTIILATALVSCNSTNERKTNEANEHTKNDIKVDDSIKNDEKNVQASIINKQVFSEHKNKTDNHFILDINYPVIKNEGKNENFKKINESLTDYAEFVEENINWFIDEFKDDSNGYPDDLSYKLSYDISLESEKYLSISFTLESYLGGAHPDSVPSSKTYNLLTGEEITLDKVFKILEDEYKKIIIDYVFEQTEGKYKDLDDVAENLDENQLNESIRPDSFYIKDNNLVIYFYSYDFLCYAVGNQEFFIPLEELSDKLAIDFSEQ